jgi:hypothetical protein
MIKCIFLSFFYFTLKNISKIESLYINSLREVRSVELEKVQENMLKVQALPGLVLVFMGSMDLLTTLVGTTYFGAVEANPLLSEIVSTNLAAFTALKLVSTVFVGLTFYQVGSILTKTANKTTKAYTLTRHLFRAAYIGVAGFMIAVLANNFLVLTGLI